MYYSVSFLVSVWCLFYFSVKMRSRVLLQGTDFAGDFGMDKREKGV